MTKTKLKLKKQVWIFLVILIFLIIGIYAGTKIYADIKYKKTNEYKFLQLGYTKEEMELLEEKLDSKTFESLLNTKKDNTLLSLVKEKYYKKNLLSRYQTYQSEHTELTTTDIVAKVNVNRDYTYYDHDIETDLSKDNAMLINKYYHLKEDYKPDDLVSVSNKYYYGDNHQMRKIAYDAFIDMWNAAYENDIYLIINSSYRSFSDQVSVYDYYKNSNGTTYADSIAARPGYSEHQTGLAIDIFSKANTTTSNFKDSPAYNWLQENAHLYGYIMRYPEGKEDITGFTAEAWHYRYVGVEIATFIKENQITYDEYYAYFLEK